MMDNRIFIDIETIPGEEVPSLDEISAPANYKDEAKIKAYKEANQVELYKKQALDSMKGRIVCIGCSYDDDIVTFHGEEWNILTYFDDHIHNRLEAKLSPFIYVGWNISGFDLPWLWRKAIQYDLRELRRSIPKDNRTCYIDLMKVWAADYKDYVSLDNCAKFLGIPHDTEKGSCVYDWWKEGSIDKIADHCKKDIETSIEIYKRIFE